MDLVKSEQPFISIVIFPSLLFLSLKLKLDLAVRPRAIGRNIVGQQIPTLSVECYMPPFAHPVVCCCALFGVVARSFGISGVGEGGGTPL